MRNLRLVLVAAGVFLMAGITAPAPAVAQGPNKVVICHTPGHRNDNLMLRGQCGGEQTPSVPTNDKVIEIEVSTNACRAHLGGPCDFTF